MSALQGLPATIPSPLFLEYAPYFLLRKDDINFKNHEDVLPIWQRLFKDAIHSIDKNWINGHAQNVC